ncbi:MAG TPA: retron St85 family effector protein [Bryobacteraceae bacterium]|nr:retron St85 family effector protein [Bryobacteraceae bacterium]
MGYSIVDFAKSLNVDRCKIRNTPNLIFLCGGAVGETGPDKSARDYFYRHLKSKATKIAQRVRLAEAVNAWFRGNEFPDLLELENYLADLADITVLFVESPGSIAELGAFAASDVLRPKTLAVLNASHSSDRSFITDGPVKARDFRNFLKKHRPDFDKKTVEALCRILFWRPKGTTDLCLSIGAPTSPLLSNILMFEFDRRVLTICAKHGVVYTRYADDLSFSAKSSDPLEAVEKAVHEICNRLRSPSLTLNLEKTVRVSKRESRRVTGLVLTNDRRVSLGRDVKRKIRAWVHHSVMNRLSEEQTLKLRGMLNYVNSVEPAFLQRLMDKYGVKAISRIQAGH